MADVMEPGLLRGLRRRGAAVNHQFRRIPQALLIDIGRGRQMDVFAEAARQMLLRIGGHAQQRGQAADEILRLVELAQHVRHPTGHDLRLVQSLPGEELKQQLRQQRAEGAQ